MDWYYVVDEEKEGPVSVEELRSLVESGTINSKTLVWNQQMSDWQPFSKIANPFSSDKSPNVLADTRSAACAECGRTFPKDGMIQYENVHVCESCKPVFVQKIKEGVSVSGLKYGGFWIRFGAKFIDGILVSIVNMVLIFFAGMLIAISSPEQAALGGVIGILIQVIVAAAYTTFFLGKFAATPGKMACGLKVITAENEKVSYLRALGRHFSEFISGIIFGIGYLMAAWDDEKRTLHDRICNTRVIKK